MKKKPIEELLEDAIKVWGIDEMMSFLQDIFEIYKLYDVDPDDDWMQSLGEDYQTIRLIRSIYLISKLSENHAGKLCAFSVKFPKLHKKLESVALEDHMED